MTDKTSKTDFNEVSETKLQKVGKALMYGGVGVVGFMFWARITMVAPPLGFLMLAGVGAVMYYNGRKKKNAADTAPVSQKVEQAETPEFVRKNKPKPVNVFKA